MEASAYDSLKPQEQVFVDSYIDKRRANFNQTKAAIEAGYSEKSAYKQGYRLSKNVQIRKAISEKLSENCMGPDEALERLASIARGTPAYFIDIEDDEIVRTKFASSEARGNLHLIKKIKQTKHVTTVEDISSEEIKTEFELYDAQRALVDILKMHGKFVDRLDITSKGESLVTQINMNAPDDGSEPPGNAAPDDNGEV